MLLRVARLELVNQLRQSDHGAVERRDNRLRA